VSAKQVAAVFGRHVVGLDQILDADWHSIDGTKRPACPIASAGFVGGLPSPLEIEEFEGHHRRFERLDAFDAALEIGARRIRAVEELRRGDVETEHPVRGGIVGARRRLFVDVRHQINFDALGSPSIWATTSK
jgi:hypothetical protein